MSATLGALVIAISTEFAVLLDGRFREERARGRAAWRTALRAHLPLDRRGRARLGRDRDRRLRRARVLRRADAAGVRHRHRRRPVRVAARRARGAAGGARAGRAARRRGARRRRARRSPTRPCRREGRLARRRGRRRSCSPTSRSTRCAPRASARAGRRAGRALPPFAMPLAASALDARRQHRDAARQRPEGARPACAVRGPEILNVCELAERGPVVLAFVVHRRRGAASDQVDVLDRLAPRHPRRARSRRSPCAATTTTCARACASAAGGSRSATTATARWRTSTASRVCPLVTFARRGGEVAGTALDVPRRGARWRRASTALERGGRCRERRRPGARRRPRSTRWSPPSTRACASGPRASPRGRGARRRSCASGCALLADRCAAPQAVALRTRPVPWAYRVLFRHLGIDPDVTRTPVEELVRRAAAARRLRARAGCPRTRSRSRRSRPACRSGRSTRDARAGALGLAPGADGRLVLADDARRRSRRCSSRPAPEHAPGRGTRALLLRRGRRRRASTTCSSRRRCGRRPPRSLQLTPRHDRPRARSARRPPRCCAALAAPAAAQDGVQHLKLRVRPDHDRAGPEHDRDRREHAASRPSTAGSSASSPNLVRARRQRPAGRRDPPAPRRLARRTCSRCSPPARRRPSSTAPPGFGWRYRTTRPLAHEPHDPQPHADAGRRSTSPTTSTSSRRRRRPAAGMQEIETAWLDTVGGAYPVFDAKRGQRRRRRPLHLPGRGPGRAAQRAGSCPTDGALVGTGGPPAPGRAVDRPEAHARRPDRTRLFRSEAKYFEPAGRGLLGRRDDGRRRPTGACGVRKGDVLSVSGTYDTRRASWYESMAIMPTMYAPRRRPGPTRSRPTSTSRAQVTHGHLPENDNHGGGRFSGLPEPARAARAAASRGNGEVAIQRLRLRPGRPERDRQARPARARRARAAASRSSTATPQADDLPHDHRVQGALQPHDGHRLPAGRRAGRLRLGRARLRPAPASRRRRTATRGRRRSA